MGVEGLTSLLQENSFVFESFQLHGIPVIIDGCSLSHKLLYDNKVDYRLGGDYPKLAQIVRSFLQSLLKCQVRPIIFLDGSLDPNDRKKRTILSRLTNRLNASKELFKGGVAKVQPIFALDVFVQVARDEMHIPVFKCAGEADPVIASVANQLSCPVISLDSDFFVFNLTGGYIPVDRLDWKTCHRRSDGSRYLFCQLYRLDNFLSLFDNIQRDMMPLLAVLAGNDFTPSASFKAFFKTIAQPKSLRKRKKLMLNRNHLKLIAVLDWLDSQQLKEAAVISILNQTKMCDRAQLAAVIEQCVQQYDCSPKEATFESLAKQGLPVHLLPSWFSQAHTDGRIAGLLRTLLAQMCILSPTVEDYRQPSVYDCCIAIRQCTYRILRVSSVEEYARNDSAVVKTQILPSDAEYLPALSQVSSLTQSERIQIFLQSVGFRKQFDAEKCAELTIFFISIFWWIGHCSVSSSNFYALLFVAWFYTHNNINDSPSEEQRLFVEKVKGFDFTPESVVVLPAHKRKGRKSNRVGLSQHTLHCFSQWQVILEALRNLNAVLNFPLPVPKLHLLFSGRLAYNMACIMTKGYSEFFENFDYLRESFESFLSLGGSVFGKPTFERNGFMDFQMKEKRCAATEPVQSTIDDCYEAEPQFATTNNQFNDVNNRFSALHYS